MSFSFKKALCALLLPLAFFTLASCGAKEDTYEINNENGYTVSVRFDANGGKFSGSDTWVVSHCYNISKLPKNADGMVEIPIVAPDQRLSSDAGDKKSDIEAKNEGYFLIGWYEKRIEHTNDAGEVYYTYEGRWDLDMENFGTDAFNPDKLTVDPNKEYKSEEPVLTLYAAWAPNFEIKYYDISNPDEELCYETDNRINAVLTKEFMLPKWVEGESNMSLGAFPAPAGKNGYAVKAVYVDGKNGRELLTGDSFTHTGTINLETGEITGKTSMNLYVEWEEEYHIYTPQQLRQNYSPTGKYVLYNDLDFADTYWQESFSTNSFSGAFDGNGHTISNISLAYNGNSISNFGLFGKLDEKASVSNLKLDSVKLSIIKGSRSSIRFGLLAGNIESTAIENLEIVNSEISIAPDIKFLTEDYNIGLVCGYGEHGVDYSGITCGIAEGDKADFKLEVIEDAVHLIYGSEESAEDTSSEESSDEASSVEEASTEESSN